jgi:hypothetical protein
VYDDRRTAESTVKIPGVSSFVRRICTLAAGIIGIMDETYDETGPEQYSDESREALRRRTDALIDGLRSHTEAMLAVQGGSAETTGLFDRHEEIETLVRAWNDAVFDHTGTVPLSLDEPDDEDDRDDELEEALETDVICVVSRIDLALDDPDELLREGRAAYSRLWPDESEEDVEAAVPDAGQALYALAHEAGEPWLDLPGTGVTSAVRAYVVPEPPYEPPAEPEDENDPDALLDLVAVPRGTLIFSESWHQQD